MKKQFRFIYLMLALALVFTLSSTSFLVSAEEPEVSDITAEVNTETEKVVEAEPAFKSLDEFQKVSELGGLELYMLDKTNKWICFAVRDVKSDKVWYSMPQMLDSISVATRKNEAKSTGIIVYQNESKQESTLLTSEAVKKGNYKIENIENGVRITYTYPLEITEAKKKLYGMTVPMIFRLTKDGGFEAGVEFNSIKVDEKSEYSILSVAVLPFFGSAEYKSDGYMVVPDGSGALIYNDYVPLSGITSRLSLNVYGSDSALDQRYSLGNSEAVTLPVFGTKGGDMGFVAVIKNGDAVSSVNAVPSRASVPFTSVYAEFTYSYQDTFDTTNNWFNKAYNQTAYSYSNIDCCSVVYYPLSGDNSDYIGMAKRYRKYLVDEVGVTPNVSSDVTFNLDTLGAITKSVSKFGFVVDAVQSVTTFEQAERMITQLNESGVKNVDLRMTGWMSGGAESSFVTNANPEKMLGGKSGMKKLISTANQLSTDVYFDVDIVNTYSGTFSWPIRKVAVRNILNQYAEQKLFSLDSGIANNNKGIHYLVNPKYYKTQLDNFSKGFDSYNYQSISLGSMGNTLYSDFNNGKNFTDRQKTESLATEALALAKEKYNNITVDKGNAYTFAHANKIISMPMYSSGYESTTSDIPFIQIALHGLIEYTESAHNLADDPNVQFLRMVETGAMPYYLLTWSESTIFLDTTSNYIYSSNFYTWNETAIKDYKTLASVFNGYCDKEITDHCIINENVRYTTYDNSMTVVVNYGETDFNFKGATVKAGGFIVVKEGE